MELKQIRKQSRPKSYYYGQLMVIWATGSSILGAGHTFTEYSAGFEDMLKTFTFPEHREIRKPTCLLFNLICL